MIKQFDYCSMGNKSSTSSDEDLVGGASQAEALQAKLWAREVPIPPASVATPASAGRATLLEEIDHSLTEHPELSEPGFGWASKATASKHDKVILDSRGFEFSIEPVVNAEKLGTLMDVDSSTAKAQYQEMMSKLREGVSPSEFLELSASGTSCGRRLRIDLMTIEPNVSFSLHSHPNCECIAVLPPTGEIFEYRLADAEIGPSTRAQLTASVDECAKVDLTSHLTHFTLQSAAAGGYIINRPGSVHLSFTRSMPTRLLVLWSGAHFRLPSVALELPPEVHPL